MRSRAERAQFVENWNKEQEKETEEENEQEYQNAMALCSFAEKKKSEGNNGDAFLTYALAGEGFLNCLKERMFRAGRPLVEVYRQMEQIALGNGWKSDSKREERFFQLLEAAIQVLEPLAADERRVLANLKAVTLVFAERSAFRLGDWERAEQLWDEAYELLGRLKNSGRRTCRLEYSELLLSKAVLMQNMDKLEGAENWGKRACSALRQAELECEENERLYVFRQKRRCCKFMADVERGRRKPLRQLKWRALYAGASVGGRLWLMLYSRRLAKRILRTYSTDLYRL